MLYFNSKKISTSLRDTDFVGVRLDPTYTKDEKLLKINQEYLALRYSNVPVRISRGLIKSFLGFFAIPFVLNISSGISQFSAYGLFYIGLKFLSEMLYNVEVPADDLKFQNCYFHDNAIYIKKTKLNFFEEDKSEKKQEKKPEIKVENPDERYYRFGFKTFRRLAEHMSFSVLTSMFFMRFWGGWGIAGALTYSALDMLITYVSAKENVVTQVFPLIGVLTSLLPAPWMRFTTIMSASLCTEIICGLAEDESTIKTAKYRGISLGLIGSMVDLAFSEDEAKLEPQKERLEKYRKRQKHPEISWIR